MVVPTWVEDLTEVTEKSVISPTAGTTIILHFKPKMKVWQLKNELERLDLAFLLFCRRLRKLEISFKQKSANSSRFGELRGQSSNTVILRMKDSHQAQPTNLKFWTFSDEITGMPEQPERPQQRTSTVSLAFDFPENNIGGPKSRATYAFMPMKAFGFKVSYPHALSQKAHF